MTNPHSETERHLVFRNAFLTALLPSILAACTEPDTTAPPGNLATDDSAPSAVHLGTPLDLGTVMRTVRLAFRPEGHDFTGGGDAYRARVTSSGVEIVPVLHARQRAHRTTDVHVTTSRLPVSRAVTAHEPPEIGAPLTLATTHLARGDRALRGDHAFLGDRAFLGADAPRIERDGHLAIPRGPFAIEHLHNTDEGLSLSYAFASPPEGQGDLTVRLRVGGQRYAGQTSLGHHYRDDATGLGVRVGLATWIDARGTTTPITVHALPEASALELRVPADVLAASAYPAVLDPILSPEDGLDQPLLGQASGAQSHPALAFDGAGYLVAWTDTRTPVESTFATRVTADGTVRDPVGIYLGPGSSPTVAFDGQNYLVVHRALSPEALRGALVSPTDGLLDPQGFTIAAATDATRNPAATFDGTSFLVTWLGGGTHLARVSPTGAVLGLTLLDAGLPVYDGIDARPALASNGANTLVVWQASDRRIHGVRVDPSGTLLDVPPFTIGPPNPGPAGQRTPTVAFDGTSYVVAWKDSAHQHYYNRLEATRVTPQGAVLDPAGILVADEPALDHFYASPEAAFDGQNTVLTFTRGAFEEFAQTLYTTRISPSGAVLDPDGVLLIDAAIDSAIASNGAGAFVVWTDQSTFDWTGGTGIRGTRLANDGSVLDTPSLLLATSGNGQTQPAIAFDGVNHLVVWADDRAYVINERGTDILAARVSPDGTLLDPTGIEIATGIGFQFAPRAVFDGANTLVAWWSFPSYLGGPSDIVYDAEYARISPSGQRLDPTPIRLPLASYDQEPFGLASNGNGALLVADGFDGVQGVLIAQDGTHGPLLDLTSHPGNMFGLRPALASDGDGYLLVWLDLGRSGPLSGARLTAQGQNLDPTGFPISPPGAITHRATLGFDGAQYLVVWENLLNFVGDHGDGSVHAARVTPMGDVLDPQGIVLSPATHLRSNNPVFWTNGPTGTHPATTCKDGHCLVAFRHRTSLTDPLAIDLHATIVDSAGTASPTFVLADQPGIEGPPALSTGPVEAVVAYSRFDAGAPHGAERILNRRIGWIPCTTSATCPEDGTCENDICITTLAAGEGGSTGGGGSTGEGGNAGAGGDAGEGGNVGEGGSSSQGGSSSTSGGDDRSKGGGCSFHGKAPLSAPTAALSFAALSAFITRRRRALSDTAQPQRSRR
ncbi:hypothetical protein [Chondromyces crocatus]|uniref:Uncharacterized protein n=1 Tax=Chondromyces crocatus TaxID=52 RepID=A0A0K1EBY3_CHOCO|nr:hypothetical protein [Chondromyces crocatus]AKT38187.1 uncharacterized protein CMC5_023300 [Chondromyces crocatus]